MKEKVLIKSSLNDEIKNKIDEIAINIFNNHDSSPNLMGGKSGELIFTAYYSKYRENYTYQEKINPLLSDIFDNVKGGFRFPTFASGLAGIGWTVELLTQNGFIKADTNSIIGSLDDFLYPYMHQYIKQGNYDYLHGAIGIGLYYLNRQKNPKTLKYIEELIEELEKKSTQKAEYISWESSLGLNENLRGYNLSLSHGLASIIVFLSRLFEAGIKTDKVFYLTTGAINFLLHSKHNSKKYPFQFPAWVCKDLNSDVDHGGRLAWCYNDLGIGYALWQAGVIYKNEAWKNEAINILLQTTKIIELSDSKVMDAGLCHGTSGAAHIYNKIYNHTNIEDFKIAATFWFEQTLKMAHFDDGLVGYKSFRTPEYGGWYNDYGFLEGISGIGLAMISAVSDIEPKWDGALLLS